MSQFLHDKAVAVAYKVVDAVNAYKEAVGLPLTPRTYDRIEGIVAGVLKAWDDPNQTAQINHNRWQVQMTQDGWVWGEVVDEVLKTHPALVAYQNVPDAYKVNDLIFLAIVKAHRPGTL